MAHVCAAYFQLHHHRANRVITRETFEEARSVFAYQYRDLDGSIPWTMYRVQPLPPFGTGETTQVDPWSGVDVDSNNARKEA